MSTLQVQTLQGPTSGADSNTVRVADGHNLHAKGHVIQCVSDVGTPVASIEGSSVNNIDSGIGVVITPKFTGSRIIVSFNTAVSSVTETVGLGITAKLLNGSGTTLTRAFWINQTGGSGLRLYQGLAFEHEEVTTSLNPLTFKIYFNRTGASPQAVVLAWADTSYALTATEIAQ